MLPGTGDKPRSPLNNTPLNRNETVDPADPNALSSAAKAALAKRQKDISTAKSKQQASLTKKNNSALSAAKKKKGTQTYDYQTIQGQSDFGVGAGPGIPWSVKHTKLSEKSKAPAAAKVPNWTANAKPTTSNQLWPIGNLSAAKANDWKLQAIKRRLGNG